MRNTPYTHLTTSFAAVTTTMHVLTKRRVRKLHYIVFTICFSFDNKGKPFQVRFTVARTPRFCPQSHVVVALSTKRVVRGVPDVHCSLHGDSVPKAPRPWRCSNCVSASEAFAVTSYVSYNRQLQVSPCKCGAHASADTIVSASTAATHRQ